MNANTTDAELAWVELAELLREGDATILHALALLRGVEPAIDATTSIAVCQADAVDVLSVCEALAQWTDAVANLTARLAPGAVEVRRRELRLQAAAALATGVADIRRVRVLASCLPVAEGFRSLSEALRCTDCHDSWQGMAIGDVLRCFQGADEAFVRRVTEDAVLSPETLWERCDRARVNRLAAALDRRATASCG